MEVSTNPKSQRLWDIDLDTSIPEKAAKESYTSGNPEFLVFRWCQNDDACTGLVPGLRREERCLPNLYSMKVEIRGKDHLGKTTITAIDNVPDDIWQRAISFAKAYNRKLASLLSWKKHDCAGHT